LNNYEVDIIIRIFLELRSPEQFFLGVPIIAVVEAKNERTTSGNSRSLALHLIYKRFFSKIERCSINNTFINHLDGRKRPGITELPVVWFNALQRW